MSKHLLVLFGTIGACIVLLLLPDTSAKGQDDASDAVNIFLPAIFQRNQSGATPTPTLINTAPPRTPTLTGFETATPTPTPPTTTTPITTPTTTPIPANSATPTATHTPMTTVTDTPPTHTPPTDTPPSSATATSTAISTSVSTATATTTRLPTATATSTPMPMDTLTATATPTVTNTPTTGPTPTPTSTLTPTSTPTVTPTSIPFPALTYSCLTEQTGTNDSVWLKIRIESDAAVPFGGASFTFESTTVTGPVDDLLDVDSSRMVHLFSNSTSGESTGDLTRCDFAGQCGATFTLTETEVTRDIGKTVECQF